MSYRVHPKELENVSRLPAEDRYGYFLQKVGDCREIWSIGEDNRWALAADDSGREAVPVWPAEAYAAACCEGAWARDKPKVIPLKTWLDKWSPGMIADRRLVAVFPTRTGKGVFVDPQRLFNDLQETLEGYEDED
jgi:hypothetical protein